MTRLGMWVSSKTAGSTGVKLDFESGVPCVPASGGMIGVLGHTVQKVVVKDGKAKAYAVRFLK